MDDSCPDLASSDWFGHQRASTGGRVWGFVVYVLDSKAVKVDFRGSPGGNRDFPMRGMDSVPDSLLYYAGFRVNCRQVWRGKSQRRFFLGVREGKARAGGICLSHPFRKCGGMDGAREILRRRAKGGGICFSHPFRRCGGMDGHGAFGGIGEEVDPSLRSG